LVRDLLAGNSKL